MAQIIWAELAKEHLRELDAYIAEGMKIMVTPLN